MAKENNASPGGLAQSFRAIVSVAKEAFKGLPPTQKAVVALAAFVAILLLAVGIILGFAGKLPPWAVILLFVLALLFFVFAALLLARIEGINTAATRKHLFASCRRVPIYPPSEIALTFLHNTLADIRAQAHRSIQQSVPEFTADLVRANIFLLAKTQNEGYKLVIHRDLGINMNYPPEWNIQFNPGQGSTGQAFKTNTPGLTRRKPDKAGQWDRIQEVTDDLKARIHKDLKWVLSMPLIPSDSFESVGVLNIDGLAQVESDKVILDAGATLRDALLLVADYLYALPYICVGVR